MSIYFYDHHYYYYSNFSPHAVEFKGKLYPTSEHAYHALKFENAALQEEVRQARSPLIAKNIANKKYRHQRKSNWDDIKVAYMEEVLRAKAEQHPEEIRAPLMASGDEEIIEDSPIDYFWGQGADKTGQNQLGKLWMKIRADLRASGQGQA